MSTSLTISFKYYLHSDPKDYDFTVQHVLYVKIRKNKNNKISMFSLSIYIKTTF